MPIKLTAALIKAMAPGAVLRDAACLGLIARRGRGERHRVAFELRVEVSKNQRKAGKKNAK